MAYPSEIPDFLILVGPTGVGKSHVGRVLDQNFDCSFVNIEEFFKQRYSSREDLEADQPNAYGAFRRYLQDTLQRTGKTVVFEQVGVTVVEQELIDGLQKDHQVVLVEVIADIEKALHRVKTRGTASNFPKPPERVLKVRKLYMDEARPRYSFTTTVRNEDLSPDELCAHFDGIMVSRRPSI